MRAEQQARTGLGSIRGEVTRPTPPHPFPVAELCESRNLLKINLLRRQSKVTPPNRHLATYPRFSARLSIQPRSTIPPLRVCRCRRHSVTVRPRFDIVS